MKRECDLVNGPIAGSLARLALPIMGTSFIQMAYNLTDMIWIGRVGSSAVAAVGAAGMYIWFSNGLITIPRIGGQIKTAHALGAGKPEEAASYARNAIQMGILFGILFAVACTVLIRPLIAFFKLNRAEVVQDAKIYLMITGGCIIFNFMNLILTGIMTAMGKSLVTFKATTIGLAVNIVMDPVLIFGVGPFPKMGVAGAAVATVLAQIIVFLVFLRIVKNEPVIFSRLHLLQKPQRSYMKTIFGMGFPVAVQSMIFSMIGMTTARIVAGWGDAAVAVQKVGSQIESIAWMTAEGFGSAVNAFIAQNHGAGKKERIKKGYQTAMAIMVVWGIFTTLLLVVFPEPIFRIFITEKDVIPMGVSYLWILGVSEWFNCNELTSAGAFQGLGKPVQPAVVSIVFTAARIPMAILLSATALGLDGVWWSLSISSIIKGIVVPLWFVLVLRKYLREK